jgi:hypothetical protein
MNTQNILIATPTHGGIHERTAAWREAVSDNKARFKSQSIIAQGRPTDYIRNGIVSLFLKTDCTHLFFLDADIEPPLDAIERLLALDVPLASGCYPVLMQQGLRWTLANKDSDNKYRLIEHLPSADRPFTVAACGAGCLLIRRDIFDKIKWPWFRWVEREDGTQESEDIFFFRNCNEQGFFVTVDPFVLCNHFKHINLTDLMRMKISARKDA